MKQTKRMRLRFFDTPKEESFENERYTLRYQPVDDRKHPDEIKAQGDLHPSLFEVFDGVELTYEIVVGFCEDSGHRKFLESMREEIRCGQYASRKRKK